MCTTASDCDEGGKIGNRMRVHPFFLNGTLIFFDGSYFLFFLFFR